MKSFQPSLANIHIRHFYVKKFLLCAIRIILGNWIRIRIIAKSWIRIRIKVKIQER